MMKIITFLVSILLINTLFAKDLEKISIQLQWLDQFQFAGYYMAKEKGFYNDVGLDVEIKKFDSNIDTLKEVIENKATYGVGRSSLIIDKSKGAKIKLLSAIFQSSPSILLTTNLNIKTIKDFIDKKIMITSSVTKSVSIQAMMEHKNINIKDILFLKHSFDIKDLILHKTDLMAAYISNEPYLLQEKDIKYNIFDPKDYGFDFYSDILFTSDDEIQNHKNRALEFQQASIRGWEYAFSHIDETVNLILKKYNSQNKSKEALLYEAKELKKLAYYKTNNLGNIDKNKIQRIYDIYNVMGFIKNDIDMDKFIFEQTKNNNIFLTKDELSYLKQKKQITVCIDPNWMPFEKLDKNGNHIGMTADYFKIFQDNLGVDIKVIKTKTWSQSLEFAKKRECDILSLAMETEKRKEYLKFTSPYLKVPLVIATKTEVPFINDIASFTNKKVGIPKGYAFVELLKSKYKNLNIIEVKNIQEGLTKVNNGELFGYIGTLASVGYQFQTGFSGELKIAGKFDERWELGVGVRDDDKILFDIFQKLINNLDIKQQQEILNAWISIKYEKGIDYTLVWQLIVVFSFILSIIIYFLIYQNQLKREIENLNQNLEDKVKFALVDLKNAQKLAKIGYWKYEIEENNLIWDDEAYNIFGIDKQKHPSLSMVSFLDLIDIEDGYQFFQAYNQHLVDKTPYLITHKIITSSGRKKYVEERCETRYDEYNHPIFSIGTVQDITEQKTIQLQLEYKDNQMLHQSRLAQMGEMISMIAHQWRQPLNAISLTSNNLQFKLIMDDVDNEFFKKEIKLIDEYSQHLSKTIDDFRGFFKDNKIKSTTTLENIVNSTLDIIKISVENKNIKIVTDFKCNSEIITYSNEIKQVVLNIIKNAEDILVDNDIRTPIITIKTLCDKDGQNKVLIIQDNGGGVPSDIIEKIFDPYYSTKKLKDGTGLGLYMSKIIIEEHCDGKISVTNDKDGAIFSIKLSI